MNINHKLLKDFQKMALSSLTGEWVIIGGAVLHLLNIEERVTLDIDLARKSGKLDETLELMKISEKLNLPVSAINQAGAFFLKKIDHWEGKLILCSQSESCKIYRPNGTLYLQLKINRMNESDLTDSLAMIKYCKQQKEVLDRKLIQKEIQKAKRRSESEAVTKRLEALAQALN